MKYDRSFLKKILESGIGKKITSINFDIDQIVNPTKSERIIYETSVTGMLIQLNFVDNWLIDAADYTDGMDYLGIEVRDNFAIVEPNRIDQTANSHLSHVIDKIIVSIEIIENHYSRKIDLPFALKFKFENKSILFIACAELTISSSNSTFENIARSRDSLLLVLSEDDAKWLSITTDFDFKDE